MSYWTRFWRWPFSISSLPFCVDKWLFRLPTGWKLSFGFWMRCTVEGPGAPPSISSGELNFYTSVHPPLERGRTIRLLELHPGNIGDLIKTTLITQSLGENPPYEALSYTWGDSTDCIRILVNCEYLSVTRTLHSALESLRKSQAIRVLWVDFLCINQSDLDEKNHQVQMMGDIYQSATSVLIYLGQATEETEIDMQRLESFLQPHIQGKDAPWSHIAVPDLERSVSNILSRTWFERIWTVQEALLARHIVLQCGPYRIQWTVDLRTLRGLVFRIKSASISPMYRLSPRSASELDWSPLLNILESQMRQAARREGVVLHRNLLDLAFDFRQRNACDPRDKYYAILGIIENDKGGSLTFAPDYSLSAERVYDEFRAEIERIGEIDSVPLQ